jgi:3'-phosphoadenosine 5'-phosphosulfate sulfotransferase (PAPS reductase)/FAD synthetase
LKKRPFHDFVKGTGLVPMTGEIACESESRLRKYLKNGCNAFTGENPKSTPLGFWTEQDILEYLRKFDVPYCSIYGDIEETDGGTLRLTGVGRTGCMFCAFGVHRDRGHNRFVRMQSTHPQLWKYCIHNLRLGEVLDYMGIPYTNILGRIS